MFEPDAGSEAGDHAELVTIPCLEKLRHRRHCLARGRSQHRQRDEARHPEQRLETGKPLVGNADDGERLPVQRGRSGRRRKGRRRIGRASIRAPGPRRASAQSDGTSTRPAAGRTPSSEKLFSVTASRTIRSCALSGIEPGTRGWYPSSPVNTSVSSRVVLQIAIRHPVRHLDVMIAERRDRHELLGPIDGQRPEEKGVDDGEDAGAGADADGQRQHAPPR